MSHRIQLKGPWNYCWLATEASSPAGRPENPEGTAKFPVAWTDLFGSGRGTARFSRAFNKPTNLTEQHRVDLVCDGLGGRALVTLNGQPLGEVSDGATSCRFEIGGVIQSHNLVEFTVTWTAADSGLGGLWGPVALEIHEVTANNSQ